MAIRRPPTAFSDLISSADLATGAALGNLADDSITMAKLGTMMSVGETAPAGPFIGQQWFRLSTGVTYQYTNDGTTSFWLDVSSGGIGTSASKSVDFVGDTDPHKATNGSGLAVGNVYYNKVKNKHFICTDATSSANVWSGRYDGWGGVTTDYLSGSTYYRVHTFLTSGTFIPAVALSVDYLIVAGGGSGGYGGGGAGGMRFATSFAVTAQAYTITVGAGGAATAGAAVGTQGGHSIISPASGSDIQSTGGGYGAGGSGATTGGNGGSGGGGGAFTGGSDFPGGTGIGNGTGTFGSAAFQGYNGGEGRGEQSPNEYGPGGGGGAGAVGGNGVDGGGGAETGGPGGAGATNYFRDGNTSGTTAGIHIFAGGGGGGTNSGEAGVGGSGGGGHGADASGQVGTVAGTPNSGGGAGGKNASNGGGALGGSGIVIIRYAIS